MEDTPGAVAPATPTTIAAFTVTGADGKPVTLDDFKGDFALVVFGRGKDIDLSASKLMRLRDVITESGANVSWCALGAPQWVRTQHVAFTSGPSNHHK